MESTHPIHGLKTALASLLAFSLTILFELEPGYWAIISTVIVMQVFVADSVEMCLYRFTGTVMGAGLGVLVLQLVPKTPLFISLLYFSTDINAAIGEVRR